LESGVLVGVGTRDKRAGFLAHGGAGGLPVFMGIGYVDGAQEIGTPEESECQPRKKKGYKLAPSAKRKIRR
jgi:hypothetical protein